MKLIWHFAIKKSYVYIFQTWKVNIWIMNLSKAKIIFNPLICSKTVQWIHPAETEFCWFCGFIPSSDWRDGVFTLSTNHGMGTGQQLSNLQALVEISQQCNWQKWSNLCCLKQWSQKQGGNSWERQNHPLSHSPTKICFAFSATENLHHILYWGNLTSAAPEGWLVFISYQRPVEIR